MEKPAPSVVIQNASLSYEGWAVFRDLSMVIKAGQWTGLLGESGVGKSSLLRLVAGLDPRLVLGFSGSVTASDGGSMLGRVAYMAQQDLLLPWATVLENVMIGAKLRAGWFGLRRNPTEKTAAETRALDLIEKVGLASHSHERPDALSGGMRQRVALARTLFEDRPIILMDEPFSSLDALTRRRLQALAYTLLQEKTVLLVTHDPMEALRLCDHIQVLQDSPAHLSHTLSPTGSAPRDEMHVQECYRTLLHMLGVEKRSDEKRHLSLDAPLEGEKVALP